ncbi:urease accessory protein UreF [Thiocapsa imhoffii]|uniref:Urease accessory protein UreF n=2 Tax=Thiocapsa imhoffii TaxID=382777 RepID=A0A9X1B9X2_9GAMM|nr:urease accessory protein UreF [Thiocapsa imhoffii]
MVDEDSAALLRLLHLASPSLPVGGFTYSQGIEWAVEATWIRAADDLEDWITDQLQETLAHFDLPLLLRMQAAILVDDMVGLTHWIDWLLAGRDSAELRREESLRGRALADLLVAWELPDADRARAHLARCQVAGFAFAAARWEITPRAAAAGYAWSWLENLVLAGVKLLPLGQTQGQQVLVRLAQRIPAVLDTAAALPDHSIGASTPALAIASAAHESQYTRLFRS